MDTLSFLQHVWYVLIGVLLLGYSILDGFDLGAGAMLPWLAPDHERRRQLFNAIGPLWDGNEVWLLTGGGALFAAFPLAYATVFSGFYLAFMLLLLALILRAVSLEFYHYDERRRRLWAGTFFVGSLLPALLYGVALGNVIQGVPLDVHGDFSGSVLTLLRPYPLAIGLLGLAAILLHGAAWAGLKGMADMAQRARKIARRLTLPFLALFLISALLAAVYTRDAFRRPVAWLGALVVLAAWSGLRACLRRCNDRAVFFCSSLQMAGLWLLTGGVLYPDLVRASNEPLRVLTLSNASSGVLTLKIMLLIALIGVPLVVGYTIFVYRVFRGRMTAANPGMEPHETPRNGFDLN